MNKKEIIIEQVKNLLFTEGEEFLDFKGKDGEIYRITPALEPEALVQLMSTDGELVEVEAAELELENGEKILLEGGKISSIEAIEVIEEVVEEEVIIEDVVEEVVEDIVEPTEEELEKLRLEEEAKIKEAEEEARLVAEEALLFSRLEGLVGKYEEMVLKFSEVVDANKNLEVSNKSLEEKVVLLEAKFSEFKNEPISTPEVKVVKGDRLSEIRESLNKRK